MLRLFEKNNRARFSPGAPSDPRLWVICALLFVFSGCAMMPFARGPKIKERHPPPPIKIPYHDYSGAIHVHTYFSPGLSGQFEEVLRVAGQADLDFVVVTDHEKMYGLHEKKEGLYGNVLILIGAELTTSGGHLVVMGLEKDVDENQKPEKILEDVRKAKGLAFIGHGDSRRYPWLDWSLAPLATGMEIYNLSAAVYEKGYFRIGLKFLTYPRKSFMRSYIGREYAWMKRWDENLAQRPFVGIASVDAHEKYHLLGKTLDSYDAMFKVVQTHVWARDLSKQAIYDALRQGHAYIGFDIVKPVRNFLFIAETPRRKKLMGDSVRFQDGLKLKVFMADEGDIRVMKDGRLWKAVSGTRWEASPEGPGVYRVEVYLKNKLWIVSNPIYVRAKS
jgi:hypothetical protein